jgi:hypothetical protein
MEVITTINFGILPLAKMYVERNGLYVDYFVDTEAVKRVIGSVLTEDYL